MVETPKSLEEEDRDKTFPASDYPYESYPPSTPQHQYGKGGVGQTQRRLTARHVTFIGFGGGIGTGLFIGAGSALASAGPAGLLLAYLVVGGILWCVMECLGEMATYVSPKSTPK
jgi:amino acid permease